MERWKEIIENSHSEYFKLKKKDLGGIIHKTLQMQREDMKENMKRFTYFQELNEELIDDCTRLSKLKYFEPNEIIYGDGFGENSYVYFLLEGKCYIIEDFTFLVKYDLYGNKKYSLYKEGEVKDALKKKVLSSKKRVESKNRTLKINTTTVVILGKQPKPKPQRDASCILRKFLQIYTFNETACFGLGELKPNRYIVTKNNVKCLLIPRYWLLAHNEANIWCRILQFLKRLIPTTEDVFKEYVAEKEWSKHKKQFANSLIRRQTFKCGINAVPLSIKMKYNYASE